MPVSGSPKEIIRGELHRFKRGQLHSGSHHGPLVKSRPQAIAIALSEARKAKGRAAGGMAGFGSSPFWGNAFASLQQPSSPMWWGNALTGQVPGQSGLGASQMGAPPPNPPASFMQNGSPPANPPASSIQNGSPPPNPPASFMRNGAPPANPPGSWTPPKGFQFGGGMTRSPNPNWMVRNEARSMLHSGPISSIVPGRTDRHNVNVASGAYVMPADSVSHLGQNNTKAGQAILSHMFGGQGPYGMGKDMAVKHGPGAPRPPRPQTTTAMHLPKFQSAGGGKGDRTGEPVPIVVAGGEFTIPPEAVAAVGGGDIKKGHKILDAWVLSIRKKHIATLKGLPPPAKA